MARAFLVVLLSLLTFLHSAISAESRYEQLCQSASENEKDFAHFRRHPDYAAAVENVSAGHGSEYLNVILRNYHDLEAYCERFLEADAYGDPVVHQYGGAWKFSPTTLRSIKIAADLRREFKDLSSMHIVEIGGGCGGLCKILSDLVGFASYTLIDLPACNVLSRKYLERLGIQNVHFADATNLSELDEYDLVISSYAFSEFDRATQLLYVEKVIKPTPRGYIVGKFTSSGPRFTVDELMGVLYTCNRKGIIEAENPMTRPDRSTQDPENMLIAWKRPEEYRPSPLKEKCSSTQLGGVTQEIPYGRLGDQLMSYFHAKWLAREYGLPHLYTPFKQAELFRLCELDPYFGSFSFDHHMKFANKQQMGGLSPSTLVQVPYFPESTFEYPEGPFPLFRVDWENPEFRREVVDCLKPRSPVETLELPSGYLTVAVHVRRNGTLNELQRFPLKLPPDHYYIEQIQRVAKLFKDRNLYVYIFSDMNDTQEIVDRFADAIQNPNIVFATRVKDEPSNFLKDFYSLGKFDCLIGCVSNFSLLAATFADYVFMVNPSHCVGRYPNFVIDQVETKFKSKY